jgi:hypothetical protein
MAFWTPKDNFILQMSKIKFPRQHPRSIVQKRHDLPSSLFITIPKRIVQKTAWQAGDIVEFVVMAEYEEQFIKVRKIQDD